VLCQRFFNTLVRTRYQTGDFFLAQGVEMGFFDEDPHVQRMQLGAKTGGKSRCQSEGIGCCRRKVGWYENALDLRLHGNLLASV
jgi:hypothetical protein